MSRKPCESSERQGCDRRRLGELPMSPVEHSALAFSVLIDGDTPEGTLWPSSAGPGQDRRKPADPRPPPIREPPTSAFRTLREHFPLVFPPFLGEFHRLFRAEPWGKEEWSSREVPIYQGFAGAAGQD